MSGWVHRIDTQANLTSTTAVTVNGVSRVPATYVYGPGEVIVEIDNAGSGQPLNFKIADGQTGYTALPYQSQGSGGGVAAPQVKQLGNSGTALNLVSPSSFAVQVATLNGSPTIALPTPVAGQSFTLVLTQDSTGGRAWGFSPSVAYPAGAPVSLTAAGAQNVMQLECWDGATWNVFPLTSGSTVLSATAISVLGAVAGTTTFRFVGAQTTGVAPTYANPAANDVVLDVSVPCFWVCETGGSSPTWAETAGTGGGGSYTNTDGTVTIAAGKISVTPNTFEVLRPASRANRTLRFISQSSAPIAQNTDFSDMGSYRIFHPVLFNAGRYLPSPIQVGGVTQNWYLYGSTDHDTTKSPEPAGIYLWTAASLTQARWTPYNASAAAGSQCVYRDTDGGNQTEYPSIVWDPDTRQLVMSYIYNTQSGAIAVSPDGVTWEKIENAGFGQGNSTEYTGYAEMTRLGPGNWVATTLFGSGGYYLLWRSVNGIHWIADPRHTQAGDMQTTLNIGRQDFGPRSFFKVGGQVWGLGATKLIGSGSSKRDTAIIAGPITPDLRGWLTTPQEVWAPQNPWEMEGDYHDMRCVYTDDTGALWSVYNGGNGQGLGLARGYLVDGEDG